VSRAPADPLPLSAAERRLAGLLRFFAALFLVGALAFFVRPNGTLADLDRVGAALGLASLPPRDEPLAADFWLALAVANMATIAACSWLAAAASARVSPHRLEADLLDGRGNPLRHTGARPGVPLRAPRRPADRRGNGRSPPRGLAARRPSPYLGRV